MTSNGSRNRVNNQMKTWVNEFREKISNNAYYINVDGSPLDIAPYTEISNYLKEIGKNNIKNYCLNIALKRLGSIEFFLHNTTSDWVWLTCDDSYLEVERVGDLISDLYSRGNPNKDIILNGHCCWISIPFLQGGSGYIFSRKAAEEFWSFRDEFLKLEECQDDLQLTKFIKNKKLKLNSISNSRLMGTRFSEKNIRLIKEGNFSSVQTCPIIINKGLCSEELKPLSKLTIIHEGSMFKNILFNKSIPNMMYWYQDGLDSILCKKDIKI